VHLSFDERASDDSNAQERQEILLPVWLKRHDHVHVSSLLAGLTTALKARHPEVDLFGVGYCFGGKHVLRLARSALVAAASFHPSMLVAEDLAGVSVPVYAGLAELDEMVPETLEHDLRNWSKTMMEPVASFTLRVYSGMGHGFAARPNAQDEEIWKQYRMAFIDAVVFLDLHRRAKAI
jgi:dienelactone hydrolase